MVTMFEFPISASHYFSIKMHLDKSYELLIHLAFEFDLSSRFSISKLTFRSKVVRVAFCMVGQKCDLGLKGVDTWPSVGRFVGADVRVGGVLYQALRCRFL